jgi:hypothetical protein
MRKRIIKLSSTSVGITLNPTVLAYLGIDSKEAINYTLDMTLKDNSIILKDPIKEEKKEKE